MWEIAEIRDFHTSILKIGHRLRRHVQYHMVQQRQMWVYIGRIPFGGDLESVIPHINNKTSRHIRHVVSEHLSAQQAVETYRI
jgi:hypothetical protein